MSLALSAGAQTKKISRAEVYQENDASPYRTYSFYYDANGRITGALWNSYKDNDGEIRVTYNDAENTVKMENLGEQPDLEWTVSHINNGKITQIDCKFTEEPQYSTYISYNANGEMSDGYEIEPYTQEKIFTHFTWENGNLKEANVKMNDNEYYDYGPEHTKFIMSNYDYPETCPFYIEGIDGPDGFDLPNPFYYLPQYMGVHSKKLPSKIIISYDTYSEESTQEFDYKFDAEGNIKEIYYKETDGGSSWNYRTVFSYETVSGINNVNEDTDKSYKLIYNTSGQKLKNLQKGLNIIKTGNGKARKCIIRK